MRGEGRGQVFFRRDGLENTPERIVARNDYLEAHPDIRPEYRRAILEAGITLGMTRWEVAVAWGFDEEERRSAFCRETVSGQTRYQSWHGFRIGGVTYTLYVTGDTLTGISCQGIPDTRPLEDGP
jgi:hypothetical protein